MVECSDFSTERARHQGATPAPGFSRLDEPATHRVSNQARGRVNVKLAHGGRSMRLCRRYAEIQKRAHALVAVAFRNQFDDRLLPGRKPLARVTLPGRHTL